jgi:hypothetical protein
MPDDQRVAMFAQTKCYDSALKEYGRLVAELDSLNLSAEERRKVAQLEDKKKDLKNVWSQPNTAGIDIKSGEVIAENIEVYNKVLGKLEVITESVKQINQVLRELIAQPRGIG